MKNVYGVEPTRYMKKQGNRYAIECAPDCGPQFGYHFGHDIVIRNNCNEENSCSIRNDGTHGYECHPQYKSSLFVNTNKPDDTNMFTVLDIEAFGIENYKDYISDRCKYPDVLWEYIQTNDLSERLLDRVGNEQDLLNDLGVIDCSDKKIHLKVSQYYLKNPSELLQGTIIVDKKYDDKLREWGVKYKWKLLYRASEHDYTTRSFHECCDDKGPTLIVIKSSEGWIFGGYATQSWECVNELVRIYNDII